MNSKQKQLYLQSIQQNLSNPEALLDLIEQAYNDGLNDGVYFANKQIKKQLKSFQVSLDDME